MNKTIQKLGDFHITLGGEKLLFELKRSLRARLIWLKIDPSGRITLTIPRGYNSRLVPGYLRNNRDWILDNLAKCRRQAEQKQAEPKRDLVSYLGQPLRIVTERISEGAEGVQIKDDKLVVRLPPGAAGSQGKVVASWLRDQARELITRKAGELSRKLGVRFSKITIRDQRTRWASCSHKGTLSFNWRLIMVPEVVLDYVILHELCHLRQMNHSKRFWGLVCKCDPLWQEHRKWIDSHSRELRSALS
jgi:predicted metal-dependent hydrolase